MLRLRTRLAVAINHTGIARLTLALSANLPLSWQHLTILTWHRVANGLGAGFDPGVVDANPEQFDRQVAILKEHFSLIDLAALLNYRQEGRSLPRNPALLTFDDGYRENLTTVLPILKKHSAKAVFFIPTGFMEERKLFFWERIHLLVARCNRPEIRVSYPKQAHFILSDVRSRRAAARALTRASRTHWSIDWARFFAELARACEVDLDVEAERKIADELILDWAAVRALVDAGMDVQSHSHNHSLYPYIAEEEVFRDASTSRQLLEAKTGQPQIALSYPSGASFDRSRPGYTAIERAGFKLGFTFDSPICRLRSISDWLRLPRLAAEPIMSEAHFRSFLAFPNLVRWE